MASLSTNMKLVLLALGEEGYGSFTNYGDVENANWDLVEDKITETSAISVTSSDVTLTDAQQTTLHLNLSGVLTGDRSIILKAGQKGMFLVTNGTTGAYTITVKPSAGTGVVIDQGKRALVYSDGSAATFVLKQGDLASYETVSSDADFALTWGTNAASIRHTGTLTANRDVTLSTTGAVKGARWRITRTGSGSFNLNIGTGPLVALRQNMWCEVEYDGSAWYLAEHGITNTSTFAQTLMDDADAAAMRATLGLTNVALYQIEKQTVSSPVSSVVFDDIPSSGYSKFILIGINAATARSLENDTLYLQTSINNGSSFKTVSGDYYDGTTARDHIASITVSAATSTFKYGAFTCEIVGLGNSARATVASSGSSYGVSNTDYRHVTFTPDNGRVVAEADNAFRLVSSVGSNIEQGTYALYGVLEI